MSVLKSNWSRLDGPVPHASLATVLTTVASVFLPPVLVFAVNTLWWAAWEVGTGIKDGKGGSPFSSKWGWRKRSEMIFPIVAGTIVTGTASLIK